MRANHAVGGWISMAAACGLTLLSTGCYSSGTGWSTPRFSSWNPFHWGSSAAVADPHGGPQLPTANATPAYPRTSQAGLPQTPAAGAPGSSYATGPYSMSGGNNLAGNAPGGAPAVTGPSAGQGGIAAQNGPPTNQGFYNENAYGPPNASPSPTQPVNYTADSRNQFGPNASANFESQPAPPSNLGPSNPGPSNPAWNNALPPGGAPNGAGPNGGFETAPPAGGQAWPNAPVTAPPATPTWPGAGATNLTPESTPATNPAAPPAGAPGFPETSSTPSFGPPGGFAAAPAPSTAPPGMTYLGDSPPPSTMGALPPPVAPPAGLSSPQHRVDPMYRPGTTKDYLPASPSGVQPATFERSAAPGGWPNP